MAKFSKADIGRTVIIGVPNHAWRDNSITIFMCACKVEDVALDGSTLKVRRPGLNTEEQRSSEVFTNAADFWKSMVEDKIPAFSSIELVASLSGEGPCYKLKVEKLPAPDAYGDINCLGLVVKYQQPIPSTIKLPRVKSQLIDVFFKHCGKQYVVSYPDNWGRCISCGSDDTYFEYSDNDNIYDGGEYIEAYHCEACGCYYREIYTVTKKKRELESED